MDQLAPGSPARRQRVDYDRIAPTYDRRFAGGQHGGTALALASLARELQAERVLEVGCGTGHWLAELRSIAEQLYGLDLSAGMLRQAGQRQGSLLLIRGRANQIPLPDCSFDLVYCVNAIHHFDRPQAFISEARRLLRPAGALSVMGMDPRALRGRYYVYDYFEGTFEADLQRFPSWETVCDWMEAAGLEQDQLRPVERIEADKRGREVLDDPFLQKDATSQLAFLSDEAYAAGIERMGAAIEEQGDSLVFPVDITVQMLVGRVGSSRG